MSEPRPLRQARPYQPLVWPQGALKRLTPRSASLNVDLVELMEQRHTRREFNVDVSDSALGEFLWLACRSRSSRPGPFGTPQESRPHPSAGGMHPIHVLLAWREGYWHRYDPVEHALIEVPDSNLSAAEARTAAANLVELGRGILIGLMAEPGKTAAKYEYPESLVWKDAGVVLGYMSVVAEALGLSFCPLGLTGEVFLRAAIPGDARVQGVGLAVLGCT